MLIILIKFCKPKLSWIPSSRIKKKYIHISLIAWKPQTHTYSSVTFKTTQLYDIWWQALHTNPSPGFTVYLWDNHFDYILYTQTRLSTECPYTALVTFQQHIHMGFYDRFVTLIHHLGSRFIYNVLIILIKFCIPKLSWRLSTQIEKKSYC